MPVRSKKSRPPHPLTITLSSSIYQKRSFTIVELLIVLLLLGVVAGLAIPNFSTTFENLQLSETAKNISSFMYYAQSRSIMKGKGHRLVFDIAHHQYWLEDEIGNEDSEHSVFEKISGRFGRIFYVPEDIRLEADPSVIQFYPDGTIDQARIYLESQQKGFFTISTKEQSGYVGTYDFKLE